MDRLKWLILVSFMNVYMVSAQIPDEFKSRDVSVLDSVPYVRIVAHSQDWEVYTKGDSILVRKFHFNHLQGHSLPPNYDLKEKFGNIISVQVFDGWLVSRNAGEFGGDFEWYSKNDTKVTTINGPIHQIIPCKSRFLALSGIYHLTSEEGDILEIKYDKSKSRWESNVFYKCDGYPFMITIVGSDIYLLTSKALIKLDKNRKSYFLLKNNFWESIAPNSMIFFKGHLYIGMRGGILKVEEKKGKVNTEWLENILQVY